MSAAQTERRLACDALEQAGPDAPTLCAGWTTHDLAAHLWVRENEVLGAAGIVVPALAEVTRQRMEEVKAWLSYAELVAALRAGPPRLSLFGLPGADAAANTIEYYIHGEDVRRPNQLAPHPLDPDLESRAWSMAKLLAKVTYRQWPHGLVLQRTDRDDVPALHVRPGAEIVTLAGRATELLLYLYGRSAAEVEIIGPDDLVAAFTEVARR